MTEIPKLKCPKCGNDDPRRIAAVTEPNGKAQIGARCECGTLLQMTVGAIEDEAA